MARHATTSFGSMNSFEQPEPFVVEEFPQNCQFDIIARYY